MSAGLLRGAEDASYESVWTQALRGAACTVLGLGSTPRLLPVAGWGGGADDSDRALLTHCHGPTLDVGCGPGRMSEHLALRGTNVLGIDMVPEAVRLTRARGVGALVRDVFCPLPGEGRWETALLADGNIGIGGDPQRLLRRLAEVLAPAGRVVLDLARPGVTVRTATVRLECGGHRSRPFPWSWVGPDGVAALALRSGFEVALVDASADRWFAVLSRTA